jgi:hypothetical protein
VSRAWTRDLLDFVGALVALRVVDLPASPEPSWALSAPDPARVTGMVEFDEPPVPENFRWARRSGRGRDPLRGPCPLDSRYRGLALRSDAGSGVAAEGPGRASHLSGDAVPTGRCPPADGASIDFHGSNCAPCRGTPEPSPAPGRIAAAAR